MPEVETALQVCRNHVSGFLRGWSDTLVSLEAKDKQRFG